MWTLRIIVFVGWFVLVSTFLHDILLAKRYGCVPTIAVEEERVPWNTGPLSGTPLELFFPFCCIGKHQPTKWVSLRERLIYLLNVSIGWGIITLIWFLQEKRILPRPQDEDNDWA